MPFFINKSKNIVVSLNYKVAYSNMYANKIYKEIYRQEFLRYYISRKLFFRKIKFYLIVRNPYNRLESFYKDKFIQHPGSINLKDVKWQDCQKIFLAQDLIKSRNNTLIRKTLMSIPFNEFIELLPKVFQYDAHLYPQYLIANQKIKNFSVHIKYDKYFKLESALEEMENIFSFERKIKTNNTSNVNIDIEWNTSSRKVVNRLYAKDFSLFDYNSIE